MSGTGFFPRLSADARASREFGYRQRLAYTVVCDVCQVPYSVQKAKRIQHSGIDPNACIGITRFDTLQCGAGRKGTVGNHRHREAAPAARISNIPTQLAQDFAHGGRGMMR
jgi:hypothetical protein